MRGASLPELAIVLALMGVAAGGGWLALRDLREERAGREAARGIVLDLRRFATEARSLGRNLAVEFDIPRGAWRVLVDGNANGVTTADILAGIDEVYRDWRPVLREGNASLDVPRDVRSPDDNTTVPAGSPPVRMGAVPRLVFTPRGTSGAASIYVAGRRGHMYVVRLLGTTQRARLQCLSPSDVWEVC